MASWLLVVEADEVDIGKQMILAGGGTVCIGRSESAEFRVRDKYISRVHASIVTKGDYSIVVDMGSENGILVNGNLVDHCLLQDGDVIRLGTAEIIYRSEEVKSLRPAKAARQPEAPAATEAPAPVAEAPEQAPAPVENPEPVAAQADAAPEGEMAAAAEAEAEAPAEDEPREETEEEKARAAFFVQEKKKVVLVPDLLVKAPEPEPAEEADEEEGKPADDGLPKVVVKQQKVESRLPEEKAGVTVPRRDELQDKKPRREDFVLEVVPASGEPDLDAPAEQAPILENEVVRIDDAAKLPAGKRRAENLDAHVEDMGEESEDPDKTPPSGIYLKENLQGIASDDEGRGKVLTAKCEECRLVKKDIFWTPGMRCPRCKSKKFFPVIVVDQEHEYRRADRTKGPADVDQLVGHIAVWANLISRKQLDRCFKEQQRMARQKRPVPGIDRMLTRYKHCQPEHISALFEVLNFHSLRTGTVQADEDDFLSRAQKSGWLNDKQVEFLKNTQEETAVSGRACKPIGYTALDKGVLSEPKVVALYIKQSEKQRGLLYEVNRAIELLGAPLPGRIAHSAIDKPWLGATAAAVLLGLLFVNILSASGLGSGWTRHLSVVPAKSAGAKRPCVTSELDNGHSVPEMLYDVTLHCPFTGEQADHAVMINHDTGEKKTIRPIHPAPGESALAPLRWSDNGTWNVELKLIPSKARRTR